jgi:ketosteroid isomerase-like protein
MLTAERYVHMVFHGMNTRDFRELERHLAPDARFDFPGAGSIAGARRILAFFTVLLRKYPRLVFNVREIIADGERVCVVWENEGHTATGKLYANRGVTIITLRGGVIMSLSDYFKDTSFIVQD